jgi:hypothetical protein
MPPSQSRPKSSGHEGLGLAWSGLVVHMQWEAGVYKMWCRPSESQSSCFLSCCLSFVLCSDQTETHKKASQDG